MVSNKGLNGRKSRCPGRLVGSYDNKLWRFLVRPVLCLVDELQPLLLAEQDDGGGVSERSEVEVEKEEGVFLFC